MRKHQNKTRCYIASEVAHMKTAQFSNTRWGIKNVAVYFLQQLLQILIDFDNFCIKLTTNE